MSTLLMTIKGNKYVNHSFFRPYLYIYDHAIVYKRRRKVIYVEEITAPFKHIVQVHLHKGLFFATLEIINSGVDTIIVKGIWKRPAARAKKLLEHKIHQAHNPSSEGALQGVATTASSITAAPDFTLAKVEKKLSRLKELLVKGHITKHQFDKQKNQFLKEL